MPTVGTRESSVAVSMAGGGDFHTRQTSGLQDVASAVDAAKISRWATAAIKVASRLAEEMKD